MSCMKVSALTQTNTFLFVGLCKACFMSQSVQSLDNAHLSVIQLRYSHVINPEVSDL